MNNINNQRESTLAADNFVLAQRLCGWAVSESLRHEAAAWKQCGHQVLLGEGVQVCIL